MPSETGVPAPLRVLIADDHHVVRRGLAMVLQAEPDVTVVGEASNGQEAVEMALRLLPDVVLLDVRMPGRDGVQAAQIIKQQAPSVRILMLTGIIPSQATMTIFQGAADGYILKDASPPELLDALRCVAAGTPYLQPSIIRQFFGGVTPEVEQAETLLGPPLTAREIDILRLMAAGHTNREIASRLSVGEETVRTHVKHILHKLDASSRTHAVNTAIRAGLLDLG